jgi:hypothetical protein
MRLARWMMMAVCHSAQQFLFVLVIRREGPAMSLNGLKDVHLVFLEYGVIPPKVL